jgi:hypothetical protein
VRHGSHAVGRGDGQRERAGIPWLRNEQEKNQGAGNTTGDLRPTAMRMVKKSGWGGAQIRPMACDIFGVGWIEEKRYFLFLLQKNIYIFVFRDLDLSKIQIDRTKIPLGYDIIFSDPRIGN